MTILKELGKIGKLTILKKSKNITIYSIDNIKVDIVNYYYKWLENPILEDELVLARTKNIAAMKIAAITGRGSKKDFIDLYFLLMQYTLHEIFDFYMQKYPEGSIFLALKSLTYFVDADKNEQPEMLIPIDWNEVKRTIKENLINYTKV